MKNFKVYDIHEINDDGLQKLHIGLTDFLTDIKYYNILQYNKINAIIPKFVSELKLPYIVVKDRLVYLDSKQSYPQNYKIILLNELEKEYENNWSKLTIPKLSQIIKDRLKFCYNSDLNLNIYECIALYVEKRPQNKSPTDIATEIRFIASI